MSVMKTPTAEMLEAGAETIISGKIIEFGGHFNAEELALQVYLNMERARVNAPLAHPVSTTQSKLTKMWSGEDWTPIS